MNINQLFPELTKIDPSLLIAFVDTHEREWPISFIIITVEDESMWLRIHFNPADYLQFHAHRKVLPRLAQLALAAGVELEMRDANKF